MSIPDFSGRRFEGKRRDAESGLERAGLSLPACAATAVGGSGIIRSRERPRNLPVVLTKTEVQDVLKRMSGVPRLVSVLMYGSGIRLMECLTLRVKDLDFGRLEICVRRGKGGNETVLLRCRPA